MIFRLTGMKHNIAYLSSNKFFCLHNFSCKIFPIDVYTYQDKIYYRAVFTTGKITSEINANKIAQSMNHFVYHTVNTGFFHYYTMNLAKQGMFGICLKDLFIAFAQ